MVITATHLAKENEDDDGTITKTQATNMKNGMDEIQDEEPSTQSTELTMENKKTQFTRDEYEGGKM